MEGRSRTFSPFVAAAGDERTAQSLRRGVCRESARKHVSSYSTVVVSLEEGSRKVSLERELGDVGRGRKEKLSVRVGTGKVKGMASKGTQTDYRESEAQTIPWKHEMKASGSSLQELLSLDWLDSEKHFPLGMDELRLIEVTRQRLVWENVIKRLRGAENEGKRRSLVLQMTAAQAASKERRKEEESRERIELSRSEMREARKTFEEKLRSRLLRSYGCWRAENESKIAYWQHQLTRKMRKMNLGRSRTVWKADIIAVHEDKASEVYAPKLRNGEDPSLRHEVIRIQCRYLKRFRGLEILEKNLSRFAHTNFLQSRPDLKSPSSKKTELCLRKFREKVLREPSECKLSGLSVKVAVPSPASGSSTPVIQMPPSESEDNLEQACLLLKRLVRGRAVQAEKFMEILKRTSP